MSLKGVSTKEIENTYIAYKHFVEFPYFLRKVPTHIQ